MQAVEDFPCTVKSGGGQMPDMGLYSTLVLHIIGEDSSSVIGISSAPERGLNEMLQHPSKKASALLFNIAEHPCSALEAPF